MKARGQVCRCIRCREVRDIPAEHVAAGSTLSNLRQVVHRTRALARTVVLMVEASSVVPTGD
jgi:histone acetyltransferase (RNA polymerase elongator complex component)